MKKKSHMSWAWTLIISFFVLSVLDIRFGILGFLCMGAPIYHALKGRGKIHCSHYCPRGSFLGKFLAKISLNNKVPKWIKSKMMKNTLLVLMISLLVISLIHSHGNFNKIAFSLFRFMGSSFIVGILMGIIFKPRSWCQVCPMGYATGLIKNSKDKKVNEKSSDKKEQKRKAA